MKKAKILVSILLVAAMLSGCGSTPVFIRGTPSPSAPETIPAVSAAPSPVASHDVMPPAPTPTEVAAPSPTPVPKYEGYVLADTLRVRSGPSSQTEVLGYLQYGASLNVQAKADWLQIWYEGRVAYVDSRYVQVTGDPLKYAYVPSKKAKVKQPDGSVRELIDNLVDVKSVDPTIVTYMIFATDKNFTGKKLYAKSLCLLQKGTAEKLKKAQALFKKDGYSIKVYDAYRPLSVQKILYSIVKDGTYIAPPRTGSNHNRGAAVDMTLVDGKGNELEMPSPIHTLNRKANRDYPGMSAQARKNMQYMAKVMRQCGFSTIESEWWHFSDTEEERYMVTDYDFAHIRTKTGKAQ